MEFLAIIDIKKTVTESESKEMFKKIVGEGNQELKKAVFATVLQEIIDRVKTDLIEREVEQDGKYKYGIWENGEHL